MRDETVTTRRTEEPERRERPPVWVIFAGNHAVDVIAEREDGDTLASEEAVEYVPAGRLAGVRSDERQRIVERLLHAANLLAPDEVSRTALTLEKMAAVLVAEGGE